MKLNKLTLDKKFCARKRERVNEVDKEWAESRRTTQTRGPTISDFFL